MPSCRGGAHDDEHGRGVRGAQIPYGGGGCVGRRGTWNESANENENGSGNDQAQQRMQHSGTSEFWQHEKVHAGPSQALNVKRFGDGGASRHLWKQRQMQQSKQEQYQKRSLCLSRLLVNAQNIGWTNDRPKCKC